MEIIVERTVTLEAPGKQPSAVRVLLGKLEECLEGEWIAPFEVHRPGEEVWKFGLRDVDALQALRLSLWFLQQNLALRLQGRGQLTYLGDTNWFADPPRPRQEP